jgi:hypothetical protein
MILKFVVPFLASVFALSACNPTPAIGGGFELIDGGGSKLSLAKDGIIVINYTVTGLGRTNNNFIIESKDYYSNNCKYFFLNLRTKELTQLSLVNRGRNMNMPLTIASVEPLNKRSCSN